MYEPKSPDTRRFGKEWSSAVEKLSLEIRRTEVKEELKVLFPPGVPPILKWRLAIFAVILLFLIHISWACGWLEDWGLGSGFALASELDHRVLTVEGSVRDIKLSLIEQSLYDAKESECTATDPMAKRFFALRVQTLSREYQDLARVIFNIPPCRNSQ